MYFQALPRGEPYTDTTGIASVEAAYSRAKRLFSRGFLCAENENLKMRV